MLHRWRILPVVIVLLLSLAVAAPASAESTTGRAEYAADACSEQLASGQWDKIYVWNWEFSLPPCFFTAFGVAVNSVVEPFDDAWNAALSAVQLATAATTTEVGETVDGLIGEVVSQYSELTDLDIALEVTDLIHETGSFTSFSRGSKVSDDSVSGFSWRNTAVLKWNPNAGCKCLDGRGVWNVYRAPTDSRPQWDFWATSQKVSATPKNGRKLMQLMSWIWPRRSEELVDWDPFSVQEYGSSGSFSLGASLSGEYKGGSGISISRSWSFPAGWAGGAASSDGLHYAMWRSNRGGDAFAKGVGAVETWKQATRAGTLWGINAAAWIK